MSGVKVVGAPEESMNPLVQLGGLRNRAWAENTTNFGYKMLMKMGWQAGKGLGKNLDGQATHVQIAKRSESLGLGCSLKRAEEIGWASTSKGFADILADLNRDFQGGEIPKKEKKGKKEKKQKKNKKSMEKSSEKNKSQPAVLQKRILYQRRITNKNTKSYTTNDMAAILGGSCTVASVSTAEFLTVNTPTAISPKSEKKKSKSKKEARQELEDKSKDWKNTEEIQSKKEKKRRVKALTNE